MKIDTVYFMEVRYAFPREAWACNENSKNHMIKYLTLATLLLLSTSLNAETLDIPAPGLKDTCPVCGMFVAKYPEWIATVLYKDGHAHHFDGAKDLFKYLLDLPKWALGHRAEDMQTIGVTEYYGLTRIPARDAVYVIGSDVLGPMGHELVPLETREDAEEFISDHAGKRILTFQEVTRSLLINLDNGVFE
uniref:nitrous oxide reductase accessory protein NosL n=2 Tax=Candidatus Vondammii sp. HM_W22 TaxID=2687299 RepID=UPI002E7BEF2A|nr:nitrous oxide reductase accessory protein NosL [Candidatus Vondammii sp. HM_W22]